MKDTDFCRKLAAHLEQQMSQTDCRAPRHTSPHERHCSTTATNVKRTDHLEEAAQNVHTQRLRVELGTLTAPARSAEKKSELT